MRSIYCCSRFFVRRRVKSREEGKATATTSTGSSSSFLFDRSVLLRLRFPWQLWWSRTVTAATTTKTATSSPSTRSTHRTHGRSQRRWRRRRRRRRWLWHSRFGLPRGGNAAWLQRLVRVAENGFDFPIDVQAEEDLVAEDQGLLPLFHRLRVQQRGHLRAGDRVSAARRRRLQRDRVARGGEDPLLRHRVPQQDRAKVVGNHREVQHVAPGQLVRRRSEDRQRVSGPHHRADEGARLCGQRHSHLSVDLFRGSSLFHYCDHNHRSVGPHIIARTAKSRFDGYLSGHVAFTFGIARI